MRVIPSRLFSVLAFLLIILLMGSEAGTRYLRKEYHQWQETKSVWSDHLNHTRFQLAALLQDVGDDPLIAANLSLPNSLGRSLLGRLRPGELDQISIYDEHCRMISVGRERKRIKSDCAVDQGFRGRIENETPILSLILKKKINNQAVIFVGDVALDQEWLSLAVNLQESMKKSGVRFVSSLGNPFGTLVSEGIGSKKTIFVGLEGTNILRNWLLRVIGSRPPENDASWAIFVLLIALVLGWSGFNSLQNKFRDRDLLVFHQQMKDFNESLVRAEPASLGQGVALQSQEFKEIFTSVRSIIFAYQKIESELNTRLRQEQATWQRKCSELNLKAEPIGSSSDKHMLLAQEKINGFLAQKLRLVTGELREFIHNFDLEITTGIEEIKNLTSIWEQGINTKSARKFIRSLSETPGSTPGVSKLDEELRFLTEGSEQLDTKVKWNRTKIKDIASLITHLNLGFSILHQTPFVEDLSRLTLEEIAGQIEKCISALTPSDLFPPKFRFVSQDHKSMNLFFSPEWWAEFLWQVAWMTSEKRASKEIIVRGKASQDRPLVSLSFQQPDEPWLGENLRLIVTKFPNVNWITTVDGFVSILITAPDSSVISADALGLKDTQSMHPGHL